MANINKFKVGTSDPDTILYSKPYIFNKPNSFDYYKFSNDGGGYYVRGLWIAPVSPWGPYTWPQDLGVPSGALKDDLEGKGAGYWGYVKDGINRNLTQGMNKNFPENVSGDYKIAITVWFDTPNYTDEAGQTYLDLGNTPIVITFKDDRFDNYNWVLQSGAIAEWSEDKRTVTIHRIPKSSHTVYISNNADKTIQTVRTDLQDVIADVTGLTYHYSHIIDEDPSSIECWDIYSGSSHIYHKDKTYENNLKKYGFVTESYEGDGDYKILKRTIGDSNQVSEGALSKASNIVDLPMVTYADGYPNKVKEVTIFRHTNPRSELWETVRSWFNNNYISNSITGQELFRNSGLTGEITINVNNTKASDLFNDSLVSPLTIDITNTKHYSYLSDCFYLSNIEVINLNFEGNNIAGSLKDAFRHAEKLREIHNLGNSIRAYQLSGAFEFCHSLTYIDPIMINWNNRETTKVATYACTSMQQTFEYCSSLKEIPAYNQNNWAADNNMIIFGIFNDQVFNQCKSLTKIGLVLDFSQVSPSDKANLIFGGCDNLEEVKIKHLNHGNWYLDGTGQGRQAHGNLLNLNQESIEYLLDNLYDLNERVEGIDTPTINNSFIDWENAPDDATLGQTYLNEHITRVGAVKEAVSMMVEVVGLGEGDRLEFAPINEDTQLSDKSITHDGVYTISKEVTTEPWGFKLYLYSDDTEASISTVYIRISNPYSSVNPKVKTAELHCPATWEDKIPNQLIKDANGKGWTIYVGGTIKTATD